MHLFYLDGCQLPVAPQKLMLKMGNQNKTMTLINEGEINIIKPPGLTEISFTALLPNHKYPFAEYPNGMYLPGKYYLDILENLKKMQKPFSFKVLRQTAASLVFDSALQTSMDVTLENYTVTEAAAEGGDFLVDIVLKQFKVYGAKTIVFEAVDGSTLVQEATAEERKDKPSNYTVQPGDNLWSIARRLLGDGAKQTEIYQRNADAIEAAAQRYGRESSANGWWIYPGTELNMP